MGGLASRYAGAALTTLDDEAFAIVVGGARQKFFAANSLSYRGPTLCNPQVALVRPLHCRGTAVRSTSSQVVDICTCCQALLCIALAADAHTASQGTPRVMGFFHTDSKSPYMVK